jgi:hypothetical protein
MSNDTRYNGWTNYATWRVNLEVFDGIDPRDMWAQEVAGDSAYDLAVQLEEFALNFIGDHVDDTSPNGTVEGWARAFIADVNWLEIAEHMMDAYRVEAA